MTEPKSPEPMSLEDLTHELWEVMDDRLGPNCTTHDLAYVAAVHVLALLSTGLLTGTEPPEEPYP